MTNTDPAYPTAPPAPSTLESIHVLECLEVIRSGYTKAQKRTLRKKHGREWKQVAALRFVDKSDIPTLDEARSAFTEFIVEYHHTTHSAEHMARRPPHHVGPGHARLAAPERGARAQRCGQDRLDGGRGRAGRCWCGRVSPTSRTRRSR